MRHFRGVLAILAVFWIAASAIAADDPSTVNMAGGGELFSPSAAVDTPLYVYPFDIVITASRLELPVKKNPAATTVVGERQLHTMPRTVAVDEALAFVPGVRIDNGTNGSRVHMSIRGQGILTESGIRGIKVLLDGLPLNDPTGFAPDFYDVDWSTVQKIEVLRGPAAALYGGGSSAGVVSIQTEDGSQVPFSAETFHDGGSNRFWKSQLQVGGTYHGVNYRTSVSRMLGDGYRDHQTFYGNNFYFKAHYQPAKSLRVTPIIAGTEFYNDNAEGLSLEQVAENREMANPDADPFDEGQKTRRTTVGLTGNWRLANEHNVQFVGYYRDTHYTELRNVDVLHRQLISPGASVQYHLDHALGGMKNYLSVGGDASWQTVDDTRNQNLSDGGQHEGALLADQTVNQSGSGAFLLDRIELTGNWGVLACVRYDDVRNKLTDDFTADTINYSGDANFEKATARVGIAFTPRDEINCYANWGQGFLPPATEELAQNPAAYGGFNKSITSATSQGEEIGACGALHRSFTYNVAVFHLSTDKDFYRYRIPDRGDATFYGNAGSSERFGTEADLTWMPIRPLRLQLVYTYSHFQYAKPDSLDGKWLPNSPEHLIAVDAEYEVVKHLTVGMDLQSQSRWQIDPPNTYSQAGFVVVGARAAWDWRFHSLHGELMVSGKNLFDEKYMGFTEPDPGGNSYQPAPLREVFGGLRFNI